MAFNSGTRCYKVDLLKLENEDIKLDEKDKKRNSTKRATILSNMFNNINETPTNRISRFSNFKKNETAWQFHESSLYAVKPLNVRKLKILDLMKKQEAKLITSLIEKIKLKII